jgi:hypothetical protein
MVRILKTATAAILSIALLICSASCGKSNNTTSDTTVGNTVADAYGGSALELLNTVWASYEDDERFFAFGGEPINDGPGAYSVENTEALKGALCFPPELAEKIDSAASLIHGMNINLFTCGVFHFKNADDVQDAVSLIKSSILANHWMCGSPDRLFIITVPGNYIISAWGVIDENTNYITEFKNKVIENISGAAVAVSEPIV